MPAKPSPQSLWAHASEAVSRSVPANDWPNVQRTSSIAREGESELDLKRAFADALLRNPRKPAEAAYVVFPGALNAGRALQAANQWTSDPEVRKLQADLIAEHGAAHFLPSVEEVAMELLALSRDADQSGQTRISAYKLYLDSRGALTRDTAQGDASAGLAELMATISASGRPKPGGAQA